MALYGKLAGVSPAATTWLDCFTPSAPADVVRGVLRIANGSGSARTVRVAIVGSAGAAPADGDYVAFDEWVREIGPIILTGTQTLRVYASGTGVSFSLHGI